MKPFTSQSPGSAAGIDNRASLEPPASFPKEIRVLSSFICASSVGTTNPFFGQKDSSSSESAFAIEGPWKEESGYAASDGFVRK